MHVPTQLRYFTTFLIAMVALLALLLPSFALAQEFVPIQDVPGVIGGNNSSFSGFLSGLFWFSISLGAILAVIMISVGGFQYMGGESVFSKEEGIKNIQGAVLGLLLLLLTFIIFTTINPDILNLDLSIEGAGSPQEQIPSGGFEQAPRTMPLEEAPLSEAVRQRFEAEGFNNVLTTEPGRASISACAEVRNQGGKALNYNGYCFVE